MTTKEQERKALEQIEKIISGLGENSYIGTAMEGMIEDARENIENDFALSWKDRAETAEKACDLRRNQAHELEKQVEELTATVNLRNMEIESKEKDIELLSKKCDENEERWKKEYCARIDTELKNEKLNEEIIRLKAKLYDLMTKEA